jgi:hypothetical protein
MKWNGGRTGPELVNKCRAYDNKYMKLVTEHNPPPPKQLTGTVKEKKGVAGDVTSSLDINKDYEIWMQLALLGA